MKKIAILAVLVLFLLLSCDLDTSRTVKFCAGSTSGVVYGSYLTSVDNITTIFIDFSSPWSVEVEVEKGDYVLLTIYGDLSDILTARIYVDSKLFREKIETGVETIQIDGYVD